MTTTANTAALKLKELNRDFSVCQVEDFSLVNQNAEYVFTGKTDGENSLVCLTEDVPSNTLLRDDGWKGFRIEGVLDFSLIGILADISSVLAENRIPIFAVSTYNTDYVFVKSEKYPDAIGSLKNAGYTIV